MVLTAIGRFLGFSEKQVDDAKNNVSYTLKAAATSGLTIGALRSAFNILASCWQFQTPLLYASTCAGLSSGLSTAISIYPLLQLQTALNGTPDENVTPPAELGKTIGKSIFISSDVIGRGLSYILPQKITSLVGYYYSAQFYIGTAVAVMALAKTML
ncbi:MAG: hypothetical protein JXA94_00470 [Parachlamydiales bacterium]|nr:hypothetical protein [Parachlamydiales bacterium]